ERAERIARYIDKRLSPLTDPRGGPERLTLSLESEPAAAAPAVRATPESLDPALGERLALAMLHQYFGGPDLWAPPAGQAHALSPGPHRGRRSGLRQAARGAPSRVAGGDPARSWAAPGRPEGVRAAGRALPATVHLAGDPGAAADVPGGRRGPGRAVHRPRHH